MVSRTFAQRALVVLVATLVTIEYAFILKTWKSPFSGYRILLSTVLVVGIWSEVGRAFADDLLEPVTRAVVLAVSGNFVVFELVMFMKRRARAKMRRVHVDRAVENALFEDLGLA